MGKIKQRDIVLVEFDPIVGHEQSGTRPAVVISGNSFHVSGIVFVCPITTKIKIFFGNIILIPDKINFLKEKSEILIGHIRSIDQKRCIKRIGRITQYQLNDILKNFDYLVERNF